MKRIILAAVILTASAAAATAGTSINLGGSPSGPFGGVTRLMLPGDPTYPLPPGLEPIEETRFELADGAWRPVAP